VLHLARGDDGVLRCVGNAPTEEDREREVSQNTRERHDEDMDRRVDLVVATLTRLYGTKGCPLSRETIAVRAGGTVAKNRTAVDVAVAIGRIEQAGGTTKRPLYAPVSAPLTSVEGRGRTPPIPPDATRRDAGAPSRPDDSRRSTEADATRRDVHASIDDGQAEQPKGKRRKTKSRVVAEPESVEPSDADCGQGEAQP
jgi:hypothetical protein